VCLIFIVVLAVVFAIICLGLVLRDRGRTVLSCLVLVAGGLLFFLVVLAAAAVTILSWALS
jgi:hypothetical protein